MTVTTASASTPNHTGGPPDDPDEPGDASGPGLDERPRRSWLVRAIVALLACSFLAGAVGYAVGVRQERTPSNAADVGFLIDMSDHHDQAVAMALTAFSRSTDPIIRSYAQDVLIFQRSELGLMSAYLADHRTVRPDFDPQRPAMAWMGHALTAGTMTGMATDDQLAALADASGRDLDVMFLDLMTAHHRGGIEMADAAAAHAADPRVRALAERMSSVQASEIEEYARYRDKIAP